MTRLRVGHQQTTHETIANNEGCAVSNDSFLSVCAHRRERLPFWMGRWEFHETCAIFGRRKCQSDYILVQLERDLRLKVTSFIRVPRETLFLISFKLHVKFIVDKKEKKYLQSCYMQISELSVKFCFENAALESSQFTVIFEIHIFKYSYTLFFFIVCIALLDKLENKYKLLIGKIEKIFSLVVFAILCTYIYLNFCFQSSNIHWNYINV